MQKIESMNKPECKLPEILTVSHLIGKTVTSLREAGKEKEMREFINEIRKKDFPMDYYSVFTLASHFVLFRE